MVCCVSGGGDRYSAVLSGVLLRRRLRMSRHASQERGLFAPGDVGLISCGTHWDRQRRTSSLDRTTDGRECDVTVQTRESEAYMELSHTSRVSPAAMMSRQRLESANAPMTKGKRHNRQTMLFLFLFFFFFRGSSSLSYYHA